MFDQGGLISRVPGWDWEDAATWRNVSRDSVFHSNLL
jgi:hypothetical protein